MRRQEPQAILFDLDGTLVDSTEANFRALQIAWKKQGAYLDPAWYAVRTGLTVRALACAWREETGTLIDPDTATENFISASIHDAPRALLHADSHALLIEANGHLPVGLVTNNFRPIVEALTATVLSGATFSVIVTADTPGLRPKPAPDLYIRAAVQLGMPEAGCLVVEDSDEGIAAATRAGMRAIDVRVTRREVAQAQSPDDRTTVVTPHRDA